MANRDLARNEFGQLRSATFHDATYERGLSGVLCVVYRHAIVRSAVRIVRRDAEEGSDAGYAATGVEWSTWSWSAAGRQCRPLRQRGYGGRDDVIQTVVPIGRTGQDVDAADLVGIDVWIAGAGNRWDRHGRSAGVSWRSRPQR